MDTGLLIVRLVLGPLMVAHGGQKLFGWFGGPGFAAIAGMFESLGFRPGRPFALAAAAAELTSGALVTVGLFGPVGPALMLSVMVVAAVTVHLSHGLFASSNGLELPLLYAAGAAALVWTGPGFYSADRLLGFGGFWTSGLAATAFGLGLAGAAANLFLRQAPPATASTMGVRPSVSAFLQE
jgi:putative oxidoreductase